MLITIIFEVIIVAFACTTIIVCVLDHYLAPLLQATLRMVALLEDSARKSAEAAATVAKIRRRVMGGGESDN